MNESLAMALIVATIGVSAAIVVGLGYFGGRLASRSRRQTSK
jgi:hypothetical protein